MFESINLIKMTTGKSQERIFFYTSKYMQTFSLFLGVTYSVVEEYVNTRLYPVLYAYFVYQNKLQPSIIDFQIT